MDHEKKSTSYEAKAMDCVLYVHESRRELGINHVKEAKKWRTSSFVGTLPIYPHIEGECTIHFNRMNLSIRITHHQIINQLTKEIRRLKKGLHENGKNHTLSLDNVSVTLLEEEAKELSEGISEFLAKYLLAHRRIERTFCTNVFTRSTENQHAVRLGVIERRLWKEMIEFTKQFDYRNGYSNLNIFESHDRMIKVPYKWNRQEYKRGFYSMLLPEQAPCSIYNMKEPDNFVAILWQPIHLTDTGLITEEPPKRIVWDAMTTFNWLIYEFIPRVIYFRKKRLNPDLHIRDFMNQFNIKDYIKTDKNILKV